MTTIPNATGSTGGDWFDEEADGDDHVLVIVSDRTARFEGRDYRVQTTGRGNLLVTRVDDGMPMGCMSRAFRAIKRAA